MDKRALKEFFTRRSTVWTLSLCMTGILVLGGIAAVDHSRRSGQEAQTESELGDAAFLEEDEGAVNDTLAEALQEEAAQTEAAGLKEASGTAVTEGQEGAEAAQASDSLAGSGAEAGSSGEVTEASAAGIPGGESQAAAVPGGEGQAAVPDGEGQAAEASSGNVISEQALLQNGISFTEAESLLWPSAGTILIDYSMDGSVYFPTLNQYKYNSALVIGSEVGNQVLAAARGLVESIYVDDETGTTLVMNIGNGYKLTYGQLKELAVEEGDIVEEGATLGYVSEPTRYYSKEGGNLYFQMTQDGTAVDPVLYLE